jgi:flagellar basal-body rod modification protein FlgD
MHFMPDLLTIDNERSPLTELQRQKAKQPVDRRGLPLPIRKSGYDALDKNSFLKLLVTQLSKQDPTNPMNDREFISQMAQFSSLEQMNNVANSMNKLRATQANELIGKYISGKDFVTEKIVQGIATKVTYDRNGEVFLSVNGRMIKLDDVTEVTEVTPDLAPHRPNGHLPPNFGGGREGGVSRETTAANASPVVLGEGQGVTAESGMIQIAPAQPGVQGQIAPAQAVKIYEANQKAASVSRETPENGKINPAMPKGE